MHDDRSRLIGNAVKKWVGELTDLTGRNRLLYYKDLKRGTLDLDGAAPGAREQLLAGRKVRCSRLFPEVNTRADAVARLKEIHRKIRELDEERGISAGYAVAGLARWRDAKLSPAAPVLLRGLAVRPTSAARDDFELTLDPECELNPVLLHKIRGDFGISIDRGQVEALAEESPGDPKLAFDALRKLAAEVPGFEIANRLVAGTFTYAKLPMVNDLQASRELLEGSDLVAAIAGLPFTAADTLDVSGPGPATPRHEFLILDADASQEAVVNAVTRGASLVVQGPPGTGKSQTIANMIATLIAKHKRVLFVAEKRAAIDAVLRRMERHGLTDLVLDIHDGAKSKRKVAEDLKKALDAVKRVQDPDVRDLQRRLGERAQRLDAHDAVMNEVREPWGVTLFDVQARLMTTPAEQRSALRVRGQVLAMLFGETADHARDDLREYAALTARATGSGTPWLGARITSRTEAEHASERARALSTSLLPSASHAIDELCSDLGVSRPATFAEWRELQSLIAGVDRTGGLLGDDVYQAGLRGLVTATAGRAVRKQRGGGPSWFVRRRLRRQARARWTGGEQPTSADLFAALAAAEQQAEGWQRAGLRGGPKPPRTWAAVKHVLTAFEGCAGELDRLFDRRHLGQMTWRELSETAARLTEDAHLTWDLAETARLTSELEGAGLADLVVDVRRRHAAPRDAVAAFDSMWYASLLDHIRGTDDRFRAFNGADLTRNADEFDRYDADHLARNADRVRRQAAEQATEAQNLYRDQASFLSRETAKQRRHRPLRELLEQAPDVLLALKPCWATSPIVVSDKLPAKPLFDVVIFDEASQVRQADAIPAIMRAKQVVVAGDRKQLPPTDFFASVEDDDEEDEEGTQLEDGEIIAPLTGSAYDSILDTLAPVLPERPLLWHYRSRDERLIGFSNKHFYDSTMVTFPGIGGDRCLSQVVADQHPGVAGQEKSVTAEVERVVELILEHAATRPGESLGVITLGIPHMRRIQAKLDAVLKGRSDLDEFFAEEREDAFFLKNLERVQGDERDAIILSVGYGKSADGRMRYAWGPLLREGGERRLNVAVTRARTRMTLVSSFGENEVNPDRVRGAGGKLLCAYLKFAATGGGDPGQIRDDNPELNPFERDVRDRLRLAGIPVIPQYGVGGYRIDFAAQHPKLPGRMVLAIEADGASYHSARNARERDRLRQQHLEKQGWRFHRIWSTDWFADPVTETAKVRSAYDQAVARADDPHPETGQRRLFAADSGPRAAVRSIRRPMIEPGYSIESYDFQALVGLARWIRSDGLLRTEDEILNEMVGELGFQRRGPRIVRILRDAIRAATRDAR